jgi:hypothetical protein
MRIARSFLAITLTATVIWTGCGGSSKSGGDPGVAASAGTDANGGAGQGMAGLDPGRAGGANGSSAGNAPGSNCLAVGDACQGGTECCSGACDPNSGCVSNLTQCAGADAACSAATDCCSLSCVSGKCSVDQCVSDGQACTENDACCSGSCGDDEKCIALNDSCKTGGNECADNGDCCSGLCDDTKHCKLNSSFCIQPGDSCSRDGDCCTATCAIEDGHTVGVCAEPPKGPAYCDKVDGMLCNGCGDCCSRLCAPGPSGVSICQPASGCHVTGDLCKQDTDCCGGDPDSGLPGAGNGSCHIEPGAKIGICSNPENGGNNACNPEGNVCHYLADAGYACTSSSARSNCCGPETPKALMCKLDALGVPRCLGVGECHEAGDVCASAADCCNNVPCVPDGKGALRCLDDVCVPSGGSCTINGDCCPGGLCHREPGSTIGSCTSSGPPPTGGAGSGSGGGSNGGASNGGGSNGGASNGGSSGTAGTPPVTVCSQYGQICSEDGDCCNGVPCTSGICAVVVK